MFNAKIAIALLASGVVGHLGHDQTPIRQGPLEKVWIGSYNKLPGDGGTQVRASIPQYPLTLRQADSVFSGISTFGRLPYYPCLASSDLKFDIAFIGESLPPQARRLLAGEWEELN
jgi:agmatinase